MSTDPLLLRLPFLRPGSNHAMAVRVGVINLSIGGPDHTDAPFADKVAEALAAGAHQRVGCRDGEGGTQCLCAAVRYANRFKV